MAYDAGVEANQRSLDAILLDTARENIVRYGWTQKLSADVGQGPVCMIGSLGQKKRAEGWARLSNLLGFNNMMEAFQWNDVPGRTVEEVLARIDNARAELKETV